MSERIRCGRVPAGGCVVPDTINAKIRFGIRGCVGDDGKTFPVRVVVETVPTDDTAQDYLDLKNVMKEDRTDPVVREAMAEWMHDAVHLNGNHMLTRAVPSGGEQRPQVDSPQSSERAFSLAGLGQARAAERGSRSIVYLKDPSEYSGEEAERLGRGSTSETLAKRMGCDRATLNYQVERYVPNRYSLHGNINPRHYGEVDILVRFRSF